MLISGLLFLKRFFLKWPISNAENVGNTSHPYKHLWPLLNWIIYTNYVFISIRINIYVLIKIGYFSELLAEKIPLHNLDLLMKVWMLFILTIFFSLNQLKQISFVFHHLGFQKSRTTPVLYRHFPWASFFPWGINWHEYILNSQNPPEKFWIIAILFPHKVDNT